MDLAGRGARVILACRNRQKAEAAISDIKKVKTLMFTFRCPFRRHTQRASLFFFSHTQVTGSTDVVYMQLDLCSLKTVRSFAQNFLKTESKLDVLINNAGKILNR